MLPYPKAIRRLSCCLIQFGEWAAKAKISAVTFRVSRNLYPRTRCRPARSASLDGLTTCVHSTPNCRLCRCRVYSPHSLHHIVPSDSINSWPPVSSGAGTLVLTGPDTLCTFAFLPRTACCITFSLSKRISLEGWLPCTLSIILCITSA